jgi:hypothetical protein
LEGELAAHIRRSGSDIQTASADLSTRLTLLEQELTTLSENTGSGIQTVSADFATRLTVLGQELTTHSQKSVSDIQTVSTDFATRITVLEQELATHARKSGSDMQTVSTDFATRIAVLEQDSATQAGKSGSDIQTKSAEFFTRLTFLEEELAAQARRLDNDTQSVPGFLKERLSALETELVHVQKSVGDIQGGSVSLEDGRAQASSGSTAAAAVELGERCSGRLDLLSARLGSVEDRLAGAVGPTSAAVVKGPEALHTLRAELVAEFTMGIRQIDERHSRHESDLDKIYTAFERLEEEDADAMRKWKLH